MTSIQSPDDAFCLANFSKTNNKTVVVTIQITRLSS